MATTSPARIDDDLYASAKLAGGVQSRSASQQIAHWARIGREIEASGGIAVREVAQVLAGGRHYDFLDVEEQAVVRAEWSVRMEQLRAELNLAERFAVEGRRYVELDAAGKVVERNGGGAVDRPVSKAARRKGGSAATSTGNTTQRRVRRGAAASVKGKVRVPKTKTRGEAGSKRADSGGGRRANSGR